MNLTTRLFGPGSANEKALQSYSEAVVTAPRNAACPCGSGRKYKVCHAANPLLSEPEATRSLLFKLERYAEETVLSELFGFHPDRQLRAELVADPNARGFMIFEGGLAQRFLHERVELLPPLDVERLQSWLDNRCDVYEVVEVDPGLRLGMRNVRTGDRHDVLERQGSLEPRSVSTCSCASRPVMVPLPPMAHPWWCRRPNLTPCCI